jgi:hypothetical protein
VIVSALEFQRPENAVKGLGSSACQTRLGTAWTRQPALFPVAVIRIEALLHRHRCQSEGLPSNRGFQRFQVQAVQPLTSEQGFDIPEDFSGEKTVEWSFF